MTRQILVGSVPVGGAYPNHCVNFTGNRESLPPSGPFCRYLPAAAGCCGCGATDLPTAFRVRRLPVGCGQDPM